VLFVGIGKLWLERFNGDEIVERILVVFWLTRDDKLVGNELFETDA
jgi:hypothetical protein